MARVVFTITARGHLRQTRAIIAHDSPSAAKRMAERIRTDAGRLAQHPETGRVVPEYNNPRIRELIVAPFRVIYRVSPARDAVEIIAIVHGSRQLPPLDDIR